MRTSHHDRQAKSSHSTNEEEGREKESKVDDEQHRSRYFVSILLLNVLTQQNSSVHASDTPLIQFITAPCSMEGSMVSKSK